MNTSIIINTDQADNSTPLTTTSIADMKVNNNKMSLTMGTLSSSTEDLEDTSTDLTLSSTGNSEQDDQEEDASERLTRVGFTSIQIRSYDRIAGDHPDVRNGGPPLGIGWDYVQEDAMDLDDYEQSKNDAKANSDKPWLFGLRRLTSGKRRDILRMQFDITIEEIEAAEAEVQRIKKQRSKTNQQKKVFARTEEFMQSAKRKVQRTLHTPAVRNEARLWNHANAVMKATASFKQKTHTKTQAQQAKKVPQPVATAPATTTDTPETIELPPPETIELPPPAMPLPRPMVTADISV